MSYECIVVVEYATMRRGHERRWMNTQAIIGVLW
jgi:hypothetical protein